MNAPRHNRAAEPAREPALPERAGLTAWRRRAELRRSNAARPIPSARTYRRTPKHRDRFEN